MGPQNDLGMTSFEKGVGAAVNSAMWFIGTYEWFPGNVRLEPRMDRLMACANTVKPGDVVRDKHLRLLWTVIGGDRGGVTLDRNSVRVSASIGDLELVTKSSSSKSCR
jgi:hypothetical protein